MGTIDTDPRFHPSDSLVRLCTLCNHHGVVTRDRVNLFGNIIDVDYEPIITQLPYKLFDSIHMGNFFCIIDVGSERFLLCVQSPTFRLPPPAPNTTVFGFCDIFKKYIRKILYKKKKIKINNIDQFKVTNIRIQRRICNVGLSKLSKTFFRNDNCFSQHFVFFFFFVFSYGSKSCHNNYAYIQMVDGKKKS